MGQSHSGDKDPHSSGELTQKQKDELSQVRSRIATEIWESEKVYVRRLDALIKLYKRPLERSLEKKSPLASAEAINSIFSNVEDILKFQEKMVYELEGRLNKWDHKAMIADIFIDNAAGLELYVTYVNNYDNALVTIRTCSKENSRFKEFLKEAILREDSESQDIHSLLITVVQRPPRYCLLLKEMIKQTPNSHKDKKPLMEALAAVEKAADHINSQKMIAEGHAQGLKIKSAFQDKFAFPAFASPKILFDGDVKAVKRGKLKIVVFANYFLVGEEKTSLLGHRKSKYEPLVWCPLESVTLEPASDTSLVVNFAAGDVPAPEPASAATSASKSNSRHSVSSSEKSSSSSSSPQSSSDSKDLKEHPPTLLVTVTSLTFTWENHEALQSWMAMVVEAQGVIRKEREAKNRPSGIFSFFKW